MIRNRTNPPHRSLTEHYLTLQLEPAYRVVSHAKLSTLVPRAPHGLSAVPLHLAAAAPESLRAQRLISVRGAITDAAAAIGHLERLPLVLYPPLVYGTRIPSSRTPSSNQRISLLLILFQPHTQRERGKQSWTRGSPSGHLSSNDSVFREIATEEEGGGEGVPGSLTRPRDRILEWPVRSNGISRNGSFYLRGSLETRMAFFFFVRSAFVSNRDSS